MTNTKPKGKALFAKRFSFWLKVAAVAALTTAAGWALHRSYTSPTGGRFALKFIDLRGFEQISRETLEKTVREGLERNLLQVDLNNVKNRVEAATWVKSAVVRRRLPNTLAVEISERDPVAIAKIGERLTLVDSDGVVLGPPDPGFPLPDRPVVVGLAEAGAEGAAKNEMRIRLYLKVIKDLEQEENDYTRYISEINVANLSKVAVVPMEEPVPVYLGDRDFFERYRIFRSRQDLYREFKKKHGTIESVDLSYEKRIIFRTGQKSESVPATKLQGQRQVHPSAKTQRIG